MCKNDKSYINNPTVSIFFNKNKVNFDYRSTYYQPISIHTRGIVTYDAVNSWGGL